MDHWFFILVVIAILLWPDDGKTQKRLKSIDEKLDRLIKRHYDDGK